MWIVVLWNRRAAFNLTDDVIIIQVLLDTFDFLDHTRTFEQVNTEVTGTLEGKTNRVAILYIPLTGLGITPDNASVCQLRKAYS